MISCCNIVISHIFPHPVRIYVRREYARREKFVVVELEL